MLCRNCNVELTDPLRTVIATAWRTVEQAFLCVGCAAKAGGLLETGEEIEPDCPVRVSVIDTGPLEFRTYKISLKHDEG